MPTKPPSPNRTRWLVLLALAGSVPVGAAQPGAACHPLLLEMECRAHRDRLELAASPEDRAALEGSLAALIRERVRFCPSQKGKTGSPGHRSESSRVSARKAWM